MKDENRRDFCRSLVTLSRRVSSAWLETDTSERGWWAATSFATFHYTKPETPDKITRKVTTNYSADKGGCILCAACLGFTWTRYEMKGSVVYTTVVAVSCFKNFPLEWIEGMKEKHGVANWSQQISDRVPQSRLHGQPALKGNFNSALPCLRRFEYS